MKHIMILGATPVRRTNLTLHYLAIRDGRIAPNGRVYGKVGLKG